MRAVKRLAVVPFLLAIAVNASRRSRSGWCLTIAADSAATAIAAWLNERP